MKVLPQLLHLAGNLKNCDGSKRATDVGGQHIQKCHRKDESSLEYIPYFDILLQIEAGKQNQKKKVTYVFKSHVFDDRSKLV